MFGRKALRSRAVDTVVEGTAVFRPLFLLTRHKLERGESTIIFDVA